MSSKILKTALFFISALTLVACDKDFNEIGTDLIGDDHYNFPKRDDFTIASSTHETGPVQTNGLSITPFGIYKDDIFGRTTATFVTQVEMGSVNPNFEDLVDVDSVKLYIPYKTTLDETDSDGNRKYIWNEIYGDSLTKMNLKIVENKYFLRSQEVVDGELEDQAYYNDMGPVIENANSSSILLNNDNTANYPGGTANMQNTQFYFNQKEIKQWKYESTVPTTAPAPGETEDHTVVRLTPGLYVNLDKNFFKTKIAQAPEGTLANNNSFQNHFRGLSFELSDPSTDRGVLNMINFSGGSVTMYYTRNVTVRVNGADVVQKKRFEMKINLTGNSVNLLRYENAPTLPSNRLIAKGGQGMVSAVDILSPEEIQQMKDEDWMINEADLIFYVDETSMGTADLPLRLYLYDMTNGQSIVDYNTDATVNSNPKKNKSTYGGILEDHPNGKRYKLRVTNYVRSLIKADSTNVRLGISTTEDIMENTMVKTKNPFTVSGPNGTASYKEVPKAHAMHPFGVILHGAESEDPNKRLKLVIYYTKPD